MADEKKPKKPRMTDPKKTDFLAKARKRFSKGMSGEAHNRDRALTALKFLNLEQWPLDLKKEREDDGRPCLVIDRINPAINQVVGDQRQNRPSIKVHPVDSVADPATANTIEGLIRGIEANSNADIAYDMAFEQMVQCGFGFMRVLTERSNDSWDQDIKIKPIRNQFSVCFDPSSLEWDKTDADWCFVYTRISKDTFEEKYPDFEPADWEFKDGSMEGWYSDDMVTIAEYFLKKPITRTVYLLQDGSTVDKLDKIPPGMVPVRQRDIETHEIFRYLLSGWDILEDKQLWPSKYFPIVPVEGQEIIIDGKRYLRGLAWNALDAQRAYNYSRSTEIETFALAPKAPYLVTPEMIEGHEGAWKMAHKKTLPFLYVNSDGMQQAGGHWPQRTPPVQPNTAITQSTQQSAEEIMTTTGIHQAGLGMQGPETAGVAINARQREGDVGSFSYADNLARSVALVGRICLDLIPTVYDTPRVVRVMGYDGAVKAVQLQQQTMQQKPDGTLKVLNDLTVGKYDCTVDTGPSYTTQRQETANSMHGLITAAPALAPVLADKMVKAMDWPGAAETARRLKAWMVMQGMGSLLTQEEIAELPQGPPKPQQPNPAQMMEMETMKLKLAQETMKVEKAALEVEKKKTEMGLMLEKFQVDLITALDERVGKLVGDQTKAQMQPQPQGPVQ